MKNNYTLLIMFLVVTACNSPAPRQGGMTGPTGTPGVDGQNGNNGEPGASGANALVEVHEDIHSCDRDGITILTSTDTNNNDMVDVQDLNFKATDICYNNKKKRGK